MTAPDAVPAPIGTSRPHPARVYDRWLGGKDNHPVDEELARSILAVDGTVVRGARANRRFMHRAVRTAAEAGVGQFLDIGTGIPTEPNLHRVAQGAAAEARVVYADNDPIVLRHAEALLRGSAEGGTEYIHTDVRDPETTCGRPVSPWTSAARSRCPWWRSPTTWVTTCSGWSSGTSTSSPRAAS